VRVPEILQGKLVGKANDEFLLIKAQRPTVLHGPSKRGTPLCNTLLQGFPETFGSTEHSMLRCLSQGSSRDRCWNRFFSRPCAPRCRLRMLRRPIAYWASAPCGGPLLLGCGGHGYGREACLKALEVL